MSIINLLPDDYLASRARRRATMLCAVLFVLVIAGVLVAAIVSERGYRRTRQVSDRVNESYAEAQKLIGQLQELEVTKQRLVKKATRTAGLLERVPRSYLLAVITQALPEGTSLSRFELEGKRHVVVTAGPKSRYEAIGATRQKSGSKATSSLDVEITVTGLAATDVEVARFIAAMARCRLMDMVDLVYSQEKTVNDSVVREFQVVLRLKPDADVRGVGEMTGPLLTTADQAPQAESGRQAQ